MSTLNRLLYEHKQANELAKLNIVAYPNDDNMYMWTAYICGPPDTPYENGIFQLKIDFPPNYPFSPPTITFITKIYHCNINNSGGICLDILKDQWSPVLTLNKILLSILSLLSDPNPSDPLVPEIAALYLNEYDKYIQIAKQYTDDYALDKMDKISPFL
jgi:ubiquitin-conjugating enzyme E2 D/E